MRDLQHQIRQNQLEQELFQSNSSPEFRSEAIAIANSCNEAYEDLIKFYHEFEHQRPSNWRMIRNHRNVHLYQGPATKSHRIPVSYRFTTQIDATIEEVQAHMSNLTTADMKDTMEKYADGIIDMRALRHIQGPYNNEPDLHILVRWFANEFPKPLKNRDFCVAEIQNGCTLASGHRAWALVQHSVQLQSCPDISKAISIQYQRAKIHHFGLLFVETLPGLIDVFVHLEIDFKGYTPSWLYPLIIKRRALSLAKLNEFMHARRQGQLGLQTPVAQRKHCQYCARKFSPLWWKIHCYYCGEVRVAFLNQMSY
ncbi:hypothetical protein THRCLA_21741 [Thraustotheca clavata]|uniref:START domain-containing protein n=1 Tax=Thraustotheca clavata TaxID=74557 RepID=A0A1V9ZQA4_9STRA|nr:hypothetical protein THRCLA_21741 [Thraustotheca clavata]